MIDYTLLYRALTTTPLAGWAERLPLLVEAALERYRHGNFPAWQGLIARLPKLSNARVHLDRPCITVGDETSADAGQRELIRELLQGLHPWRKGPFNIHGVEIDAEWRSDRKWARLQEVIAPLEGRLVLDMGCGNGYYAWRMVGAGARLVLGVDPSLRFLCQYEALSHFIGPEHPAWVLPLALEALPAEPPAFDTLFSMGVFYHRSDPFEHLIRLRGLLRPGGQLVLETLVIEGEDGEEGGKGSVLVPEGRYAQMRNVWFIPAPPTLLAWMRRAGFHNPRVVDVTPTGTEEQRSTEWMRFYSLADFLDPEQPQRTVEGLPAPVRAIFLAEKPS